MYGSYGSYSAMSSPMDINSGSNYRSQIQDSSCAFPSWPRRPSLSNHDSHSQFEASRSNSYISDDELFFEDTFESDSDSISSSSTTPCQYAYDEVQAQRERAAYQLEMQRLYAPTEKAKKHVVKKGRRRGSSTSKKGSPKSKLASMTPIVEVE